MERAVALVLFILVSPLISILFLVVRLTSRGPFIFKQRRAGRGFQPFLLYKIRTMRQNAEAKKQKLLKLNEADGPVFKIRDDPRFTDVGKILSRTGLDEILQLVNIVKGEMNFVGPRPLPIEEAKRIPTRYHSRSSVKPGITSSWIIKGAHNLTFKQWMESDLEYVRKKNVLLDLHIIILTLFLILQWTIKELKQSVIKSFPLLFLL